MFCVHKKTIFQAKSSLFFSVSPFHIKLHDNPIYFCLKTAHSRFFPFFYALSQYSAKARILSHIAEWAIRSSTNIVIWKMNSRALNKHAVVATGRTWSYSRARICKWQHPPVSWRSWFLFRIPDFSRDWQSICEGNFLSLYLNNFIKLQIEVLFFNFYFWII